MTKTVKIILISALSLVMAALVFYCVQFGQTPEEKLAENPTVSTEDALQTAEQLSAAAETAWQNGTAGHITLSDEGSSASASGVQIQGNTVTVTSSGIYSISGTLTEGQLTVDCDDTVVLILESAEITPVISVLRGPMDLVELAATKKPDAKALEVAVCAFQAAMGEIEEIPEESE